MKELICIVCPKGCHLKVDENFAVTGNSCPRGATYGKTELTHPTRIVTSTVRCVGGLHPRCPVKTGGPIPKALLLEAVRQLDNLVLTAPVHVGDTVLSNVCGTGVPFIATREMPAVCEGTSSAVPDSLSAGERHPA